MTIFPLLAIIPAAPLVGAAYNAFLGAALQKRFGRAVVHIPAIAMPTISFLVTLVAFGTMLMQPVADRGLTLHMWDWMVVGSLNVGMNLVADQLSMVMCLVVTFIGTLIHVYSVGYMHEEASYWRFFCYLNLFMFAMLMLVLGDNFVVMFVGWEGVGLCSYLLIGFWYKERKNAAAGMKAFVVNRVGDFGFVLGVFLLFWTLQGIPGTPVAPNHTEEGSTIETVQNESPPPVTSVVFRELKQRLEDPVVQQALTANTSLGLSIATIAAILFFVGAMGKSAQLPLYVWLPDAMAGPTPVSALIHAATMVTAGVYMVARLHFLYLLSPLAMAWVAVIGCLTALFAATIGFFQYDIKKVLAYSTISQLGFMFIAVGVGSYVVGIFHLVTHAFFKACLFLGSGSVIMGCHHEQDMRHMGGLRERMPVTHWTYLAACCAISGFPLTAGFFSKDEILWKAFSTKYLPFSTGGLSIWLVASVTSLCTAYYMFRSYYMTFSGDYRGDRGVGHGHKHGSAHGQLKGPHESPRCMTWVLAILGVLSLCGGLVGLPRAWHLPNALDSWLEPVFESRVAISESALEHSSLEWVLMGFSVVLALTGWSMARWLYKDARNSLPATMLERKGWPTKIYDLVFNKYYVDELYQRSIIRFAMGLKKIFDIFDRRFIDAIVNRCGRMGCSIGFRSGSADANVIDGAVTGIGAAIVNTGATLRHTQTGNIRVYLYAIMTGAMLLVIINYLILG